MRQTCCCEDEEGEGEKDGCVRCISMTVVVGEMRETGSRAVGKEISGRCTREKGVIVWIVNCGKGWEGEVETGGEGGVRGFCSRRADC